MLLNYNDKDKIAIINYYKMGATSTKQKRNGKSKSH